MRINTMLEWARTNAPVVQAAVALISAAVAVLLYILARQQTQAGRLNAIREVVRQHHSHEMRELRRVVRSDLLKWFEIHAGPDESNAKWMELKAAYEDILNYYEYLGSLLKDKLIDEDIVLRTTHNSAVAIWDIHQQYGDRIRPPSTRGPDFAGEFAYLVDRARIYRKAHGLVPADK